MVLEENLVVADRFRLVRMIGRGGMGSVWQAVHIALDQPCALKFIEGQVTDVTDAHARFAREAKAAAALRSPHVVQIIDHGVWAGRPYIAMELLEGEDLGKVIVRGGGKLAPAQIVDVVEQVCRALTRAHAAGFVHRDLKPDNIFLVNDDDRLLVKILDFGVAKQTSQAIDGSNTKTGAMLGTPYYMSPEQAQGIKSVDARSDLWSLAVIVFQCLTGRLPFESEALGDLLVKIIVQPVPVPSQLAPVPPGFDAWWLRASDRNPDRRFATAKELASTLATALGFGTAAETPARPVPTSTLMVAGPGRAPSTSNAMAPAMQTPAPYGPAAYGMATGPQPALEGSQSQSGSARAFSSSGVAPRKGPPSALLAIVGLALLAVLAGGGLLAARRWKAARPSTTPSAVLAQTAPVTPAASALPVDRAPLEPASATPVAQDNAAGAATTTSVPASTAVTKRPESKPADRRPPPAGTPPSAASANPTKPPPPAASPGWNPGF